MARITQLGRRWMGTIETGEAMWLKLDATLEPDGTVSLSLDTERGGGSGSMRCSSNGG